MDCGTTTKQRRPHEVAKFLRTFCVDDRHEATNLLLTLGLHALNEEKARQKHSERLLAQPSIDCDVMTLRRLRETVCAVRGSNKRSPVKRGGSPKSGVAGTSPDVKRRADSVESRHRSPRCTKCFLDAMSAVSGAGPTNTAASGLGARSRERSPPIRSLIERDKKQYYAATGGAAQGNGPHSPTFQLVVGPPKPSPDDLPSSGQCDTAPPSETATATRRVARAAPEGGAVPRSASSDSRLGSIIAPAVKVVLHNVEAAQRHHTSGAQPSPTTSMDLNHHMVTASMADRNPPLHADVLPASAVAPERNDAQQALAAEPEVLVEDTLVNPPSQSQVQCTTEIPLPDSEGSHADIPPGALKALWAFVCRERGARRTRLVVAGALPAEWSAITVSDAFKNVYQSLLLAYHLQACLSDAAPTP